MRMVVSLGLGGFDGLGRLGGLGLSSALVLLVSAALFSACGTETPILCETQGCQDGDPCTQDQCLPASGCRHTPVAGVACATDGDPCTQDICQLDKGCVHPPEDGAPCSDDNPCTLTDACKDGACAGTGAPDCSDQNPCTADLCVPPLGCQHKPQDGPCGEASACTGPGQCQGGLCIAGAPIDCSDGDSCTADACTAAGGCSHSPDSGAPCDDGSGCTQSDVCTQGACGGEVIGCEDGNPCTVNGCDPLKGCTFAAGSTATCDDGNACTAGDACAGSWCQGQPLSCADSDPCTLDSCDPKAGCQHTATAAGAPCDDGDACSEQDACQDQQCAGVPLICLDGNPCTADSCDPKKGCQFAAKTGACSDGNACTQGDICQGGLCVGPQVPDCDDSNPCTTADCLPDQGCVQQVLAGLPCDDQNPCTLAEICQAKSAACAGGKGLSCDDANTCTDDSCDPKKGCVHKDNNLPCDDGDQCILGEQCYYGYCTPGKPMGCNDSNPCTDDWCAGYTGCVYPENQSACDDGNACTVGDTCVKKACIGQDLNGCNDSNVCTVDACDKQSGACSHKPLPGLYCDDGNPCASPDVCDAKGECKGAGNTCDDANACTADSCDLGQGGACIHKAIVCDDGRPCTADSCDKISGCQFKLTLGAPCSDGNACTSGDACVGVNSCVGSAITCNDSNPCTDDHCLKASGCIYDPNTAACDDGSVCTLGDACAAGKCAPGAKPLNCSDGNGCTADTCDAKQGCAHGPSPEWTACDVTDGNMICTSTGSCIHAAFVKQAFFIPSVAAEFGCNSAVFSDCPSAELPLHTATLDPFYIDYTEARVSDYAKCVDAGKCPAVTGSQCNASLAGKADHPANCLSRAAAVAYCQFKGKRLPTEHEWERAARGPDCTLSSQGICLAGAQVYPWGTAAATCDLTIFQGLTPGCGAGGTWSVGAGWHSAWGLFGMAGNVAEWVADGWSASAYQSAAAVNPKGPPATSTGVVRGGSAWSYPGALSVYHRASKATATGDLTLGVRCAHDFAPQ